MFTLILVALVLLVFWIRKRSVQGRPDKGDDILTGTPHSQEVEVRRWHLHVTDRGGRLGSKETTRPERRPGGRVMIDISGGRLMLDQAESQVANASISQPAI